MSKSIRLHPKHGVNPTMPVCFWCGEPDGSIALLGAAYKEEAPRHMILDRQPCATCKEHWSKGIVLTEADDSPDHVPTGRWAVITHRAARLMFDKNMHEGIMKYGRANVDKALFDLILNSQTKDPEA